MKKLFAIMLTALMLLMSVAAVAETGAFTKAYEGAQPVGDVLTFKVEFVKEMATGSTTDPELITGLSEDGTFTHTVTATADKKNSVSYTYNQPQVYGSYIYKITEVIPATPGYVTYDAEEMYIMVNYLVDENGVPTLITNICNNPNDTSGDPTAKTDGFINNYALGGFDVTKTIQGNAADKDDKFVIQVTFESTKDLNGLNIGYLSSNAAEGTAPTAVSFTSLTANTPVSYNITIGDGETISFTGVPQGVKVSITETKQDGKDDLNHYTATYENQVITVSGTVQTMSVTNTKSALIPTGVYMDYIPYVVLVAVAVIAIVVIAARKRARSENDD